PRLGLRARTVLLLARPDGYAASAPPDEALLARLARAGIHGVGPSLELVLAPGEDGDLVDTGLVAHAHDAGLVVHPWTFRAENTFLLPPFRSGDDPSAHGDLAGQLTAFLDAGVDGLFVDHVDVAVAAVAQAAASTEVGRGRSGPALVS